MTREEIFKEYSINNIGVIETPGKFEGEMLYVPYFYADYLDGMQDEELDDGSLVFYITKDDRESFPELPAEHNQVLLTISDDGFVSGTTIRC